MTPLLGYRRQALVSGMTLGVLEDLGYAVNPDEEDAFGLGDLGDCRDFCPEAGSRNLQSSNLTKPEPRVPKLSKKAEAELLNAAADRFRTRQQRHLQTGVRGSKDNSPAAVSYIYEENGEYFSRIIRRSQVEHLI
eukprot:scaffold1953_cov176-Amphora_coffeaeformis.AAC.19